MFRKIENSKVKCSKAIKDNESLEELFLKGAREIPEDGSIMYCMSCECFIFNWGDHVECKFKGD